MKTQDEILKKLDIEILNPMQEDAALAIENSDEIILLSPTGTGKTLAFLLPLLKLLNKNSKDVQALILVPSRELALQIEQVFRDMGSGYKANAVYGGRPIAKDKEDLKHTPAVLIGTPGRVMDHMQRGTVQIKYIKYFILDEFDKILEVGFEEQMKEIISMLSKPDKIILTSATEALKVPDFIGIQKPLVVDYLQESIKKLNLKIIESPQNCLLYTSDAADE